MIQNRVSAWLDNMGYPRLADIVMDEKRFPPAQLEPHWILCSEQLPETGHKYLYCTDMGTVHMGVYWSGLGFGYGFKYVVAWMPLPEPYREDDHEND